MRLAPGHEFDAGFAVVGLAHHDEIPFEREQIGQTGPQHGMVVDQEDANAVGDHRWPWGRRSNG